MRRDRSGFDSVILGGGCAGLSLAEALSRPPEAPSLLVVEPRTRFPRDRTWCYWDVAEHPFEAAVTRSWRHWKVRWQGRERVHDSQRFAYRQIPADAFYELALSRLRERDGVELQLGSKAIAVRSAADHALVETDAGTVRAQRVFDGRPPGRPEAPCFLQHFVGLQVEAPNACFDPEVVTLMDFDVPQRGGIHFFYVLPQTRHQALVEATFLSDQPFPEPVYLDAIERYLHERHGVTGFRELDRERGAIPMSPVGIDARAGERVYRIGTAGGLVRPSTGYAFLAIQRFTSAFAEQLRREALPDPPEPRAWATRALDAIFLSFLRRHPEQGPSIFAALFDRTSPDTLVRFLADVPTARDRLAVMRALPVRAFASEAWRSRREWWRA